MKAFCCVCLVFWAFAWTGTNCAAADWAVYGGDAGQRRYSELRQIDAGNVSQLKVAWTYHSGDARGQFSQMQCNPLIVAGVLYAVTPGSRVIALNAATGAELWAFDALTHAALGSAGISRGVTLWSGVPKQRLFVTVGPYLYALNAGDGTLASTFGTRGRVDLRLGLGRDPQLISIEATSPGLIYRDLIILGSRVGEGAGAAPGYIRAYDAKSGQLRWTFHTIPQPGEYGHDTWPAEAWRKAGGANSWAGMSVDTQRGLVFVPTGSASYDFYGADRHGDNLFANSVLALDAATGRRVWHFQTVHHDLWDRDLPAPPTLATLHGPNGSSDVVIQVTKQGYTFVFDRATGRPYHPIEERPAPPSDLPGERAAATQPIPVRPPPFVRQTFTEDLLPKFSEQAHASLLERWRTLRPAEMYRPPSVDETAILPGFDGGAEWGGAAFDPGLGLLYVNASDVPYSLQMLKLEGTMSSAGSSVYLRHCAGCHGADLAGDGVNIPALTSVRERYSLSGLYQIIRTGRGRMPGLADLPFADAMSLLTYLLEEGEAPMRQGGPRSASEQRADSYIHTGYKRFTDPQLETPAIKPPWGTLTAIDLQRGELRWQIPLGYYPHLADRIGRDTGAENYGGPIVTASGLVFIAATPDEMFRAFDNRTGKLLWETKLPAAGFATPATYSIGGRQYVVVAAGGGKLGRPSGDAIVAFALPTEKTLQ